MYGVEEDSLTHALLAKNTPLISGRSSNKANLFDPRELPEAQEFLGASLVCRVLAPSLGTSSLDVSIDASE